MRIAFYAPMKHPDHPVPSGDRQMARLLIRALTLAGHTVEVASRLRSFVSNPADPGHDDVRREAAAEVTRLSGEWSTSAPPDLWFCYHPYYKAPDFVGPPLARQFAIPYVTAEASYAGKRNVGPWGPSQQVVADAVRLAALNIGFTRRDLEGLAEIAPTERLVHLPPFIDTAPFAVSTSRNDVPVLVTVAMMRPGDKLESYRLLARSLELCAGEPWRLRIVGDGPCRDELTALFAGLGDRVEWLGERSPEDIPAILAASDILVWPGFGEAFGLAYLEGQASGLPVVAQNTAGVPEVVENDKTGILTSEGDAAAFAGAIRSLLGDPARRADMGTAARAFVTSERSLEGAATRLGKLLDGVVA
jgi:glycosyltransferase involved in cell wall biosynthesis